MFWQEEQIAQPLVIAIDGPAASGKGTLARNLAKCLHLPHLDSGRLYRAVAYKMLLEHKNPLDPVAAFVTAQTISAEDLNVPSLHTEEIGKTASMVASIPEVRGALLQFQRNFVANPKGAVLDGRDIGTVICPEADIKIYVTADIQARARRRFNELQQKGIKVMYDDVLADLQERDKRDSTRSVSPLVVAKDAICIDTTDMDADMVLNHVLSLVVSHLKTSTNSVTT